MIQLREFCVNSTPIFKIGRTHDVTKRAKQYPKGSALITCCQVDEEIVVEDKLNALIDKYGLTRKYLIEINGELKVMTFDEYDKMNAELDEFDGIQPYIIKGRVI